MTLRVLTERDVNLLTGGDVLRVRYRRDGARLWTRFVIVPDADQTVAELEALAHEAALAHHRASRVSERATSSACSGGSDGTGKEPGA